MASDAAQNRPANRQGQARRRRVRQRAPKCPERACARTSDPRLHPHDAECHERHHIAGFLRRDGQSGEKSAQDSARNAGRALPPRDGHRQRHQRGTQNLGPTRRHRNHIHGRRMQQEDERSQPMRAPTGSLNRPRQHVNRPSAPREQDGVGELETPGGGPPQRVVHREAQIEQRAVELAGVAPVHQRFRERSHEVRPRTDATGDENGIVVVSDEPDSRGARKRESGRNQSEDRPPPPVSCDPRISHELRALSLREPGSAGSPKLPSHQFRGYS